MAEAKILVVDDEEIVHLGFAKVLEEEGYEVAFAFNGDEAVVKSRGNRYDIAFIDYVLPGMDGVTVCRAIGEVSPSTIRIFMTGKVDKDTTAREVDFLAAGGKVFFLYKPFSREEIIQVVHKALAERKLGV